MAVLDHPRFRHDGSSTLQSSAGWTNLTSASGQAEIPHTAFTPGREYLVIALAGHRGVNRNQHTGLRLVEIDDLGVNQGVLGNSQSNAECVRQESNNLFLHKPWMYFTLWTAPTDRGLRIQIFTQGASARTFHPCIHTLDITDLTKHYDFNNTSAGLSTTFTTASSVNFTPDANSTWLVATSAVLTPDASSNRVEARMDFTTSGRPVLVHHSEEAEQPSLDRYLQTYFETITFGASPGAQTVLQQCRSNTINTGTRLHSQTFAMPIDQFDFVKHVHNSNSIPEGGGDWGTIYGSTNWTGGDPNPNTDTIVLACYRSNYGNGSGRGNTIGIDQADGGPPGTFYQAGTGQSSPIDEWGGNSGGNDVLSFGPLFDSIVDGTARTWRWIGDHQSTGSVTRRSLTVFSTSADVGQVRAMDAIVAATATCSASLSVDRPIDATATASSTSTTGALSVTRPITAVSAATSGCSASLSVTRGLTTSVDATSTCSGAIERAAGLTTTAAATSTCSASLSVTRPLDATAAASSTGTTGALSVTRPIDAVASATSTVASQLTITIPFDAVVSATSGVSASLSVTRGLTATVAATSATAAEIERQRDVTATVTATSGVSASLSVTRQLSATVSATSTVAAELTTGEVALDATVTATSGVSASLSVIRPWFTSQGPFNEVASASVSEASEWSGCAYIQSREQVLMVNDGPPVAYKRVDEDGVQVDALANVDWIPTGATTLDLEGIEYLGTADNFALAHEADPTNGDPAIGEVSIPPAKGVIADGDISPEHILDSVPTFSGLPNGINNAGMEGICFDPVSGKYYVVVQSMRAGDTQAGVWEFDPAGPTQTFLFQNNAAFVGTGHVSATASASDISWGGGFAGGPCLFVHIRQSTLNEADSTKIIQCLLDGTVVDTFDYGASASGQVEGLTFNNEGTKFWLVKEDAATNFWRFDNFTSVTTLVDWAESWFYDSGTDRFTDQGVPFHDPAYNEATSFQGPAPTPIGFGTINDYDPSHPRSPQTTNATIEGAVGTISIYGIIDKTLPGKASDITKVSIQTVADDGIVVFINGNKIADDNAAGTPAHGLLADSVVGAPDEGAILVQEFTDPTSLGFFQDGTNRIAFLGCNQSSTSSDMTCDVRVVITQVAAEVALDAIVSATSTAAPSLSVTREINATSAATSTTAAALSTTRSLSAVSAATSGCSASLSVTRQLDATSAATSTVAAEITRTRGLTALVSATSTVASSIEVSRALDAIVSATAATAAALSVTRPIDAISAATSSSSAALSVTRALDAISAATSTIAAELTRTRGFTATVTATSTTAAALSVTRQLDAASAAISATAAALSVTRPIDAVSAATSTVAASLSVTRELTAIVAAVSTVSAELTRSKPLDAIVTATSGVSAALSVTRQLTAASAATSTVAAQLEVARGLTAQVDAVAAVSALLSVEGQVDLMATVTATGAVAASLSVTRPIDAVSTAVSGSSASLSVTRALDAVSAATSATSAVLQRAAGLIATAAATSASSAALSVTRPLDAVVTATSTVAAELSTQGEVTLDAIITATSGVSAALSVTRAIDAVSSATAATTGALSVTRPLDSVVSATATTSGALSRAASLTATCAATSTVAAELTVLSPVALDAVSAATSSCSAQLSVDRPFDATSQALASTAAALSVTRELTAASAANSQVAAILGTTEGFTAVVTVASTVAADLSVTRAITSASAANSTVTAEVAIARAMATTVAALSTTNAVLTRAADLIATVQAQSQVAGAILTGNEFKVARIGATFRSKSTAATFRTKTIEAKFL